MSTWPGFASPWQGAARRDRDARRRSRVHRPGRGGHDRPANPLGAGKPGRSKRRCLQKGQRRAAAGVGQVHPTPMPGQTGQQRQPIVAEQTGATEPLQRRLHRDHPRRAAVARDDAVTEARALVRRITVANLAGRFPIGRSAMRGRALRVHGFHPSPPTAQKPWWASSSVSTATLAESARSSGPFQRTG